MTFCQLDTWENLSEIWIKLEQPECLCSEDNPCHPMITHTIDSSESSCVNSLMPSDAYLRR